MPRFASTSALKIQLVVCSQHTWLLLLLRTYVPYDTYNPVILPRDPHQYHCCLLALCADSYNRTAVRVLPVPVLSWLYGTSIYLIGVRLCLPRLFGASSVPSMGASHGVGLPCVGLAVGKSNTNRSSMSSSSMSNQSGSSSMSKEHCNIRYLVSSIPQ